MRIARRAGLACGCGALFGCGFWSRALRESFGADGSGAGAGGGAGGEGGGKAAGGIAGSDYAADAAGAAAGWRVEDARRRCGAWRGPEAGRFRVGDGEDSGQGAERCGVVPADVHGARDAVRLRPDGGADLVSVSCLREWADAGDSLLQRAAGGAGRRPGAGGAV